jgi:hypothetical protein
MGWAVSASPRSVRSEGSLSRLGNAEKPPGAKEPADFSSAESATCLGTNKPPERLLTGSRQSARVCASERARSSGGMKDLADTAAECAHPRQFSFIDVIRNAVILRFSVVKEVLSDETL